MRASWLLPMTKWVTDKNLGNVINLLKYKTFDSRSFFGEFTFKTCWKISIVCLINDNIRLFFSISCKHGLWNKFMLHFLSLILFSISGAFQFFFVIGEVSDKHVCCLMTKIVEACSGQLPTPSQLRVSPDQMDFIRNLWKLRNKYLYPPHIGLLRK